VEPEGNRVIRRLRPTQSELGQIDPAAYFEFQKGVVIEYIAPDMACCLVELDEEPPHPICIDALATAIAVAKHLKCKIVDEFHVMRKVVIDGSNTSGFQRTLVVALDGELYVNNKRISIQTVCLEEEAARIIERSNNKVIYSLDRLGIPLIEIATGPDISDPDEAVDVAAALGRIVSATGLRRRGLGSIRQDVNISIDGGNVVEVKGIQKLTQLRKVVEFEHKRQVSLNDIARILRERKIDRSSLIFSPREISNIFADTKSKLIKRLLKGGNKVYALKLPSFSGILGMETAPNYRLGKEMAERVRFWTGLGGIFHSDELPNYGISGAEVSDIREALACRDEDAFVLVIADEKRALIALEKIYERALEALDGVPKETRGAKEDGTTFYMRPRPGMARMYPETDIPPIPMSKGLLSSVEKIKIRDPEAIIEEIVSKYGLNERMAWNLYDSDFLELFIKIVSKFEKVKPTFVASLLTETIKALERMGSDITLLNDKVILDTFDYVERGIITKDVISDIWELITRDGVTLDNAIKKVAVSEKPSEEEVRQYIWKVLKEHEELSSAPEDIRKKKLIGFVMSKYRGIIDPKLVIKLVEEVLGEDDG
jgi:glutamyl-tRNA(Gln) amidotransferase subunit E